ncbi:MAG: hypothetical protein PHU54_09725 [Candidatus Omnitrophica bacterium]|nr:hypothetical protein [Candidatus Omnitrophota bacterium]
MAEIRYRIPTLHSGQRTVYEHPARFKWLAAGRRWRKTTLAVRVALRVASAGDAVLWGAPTFRQCRIGWAEAYRAAGGIATFHKGNMEIVAPPGAGVISFVSLDSPDSARGKTANLAIIDEAGFVPELAWQEVVRPMLSDTSGAALIMGTPKGRNWFWREHVAARDYPDSAAWQVPTLGVRIVDGTLERAPHRLENPEFPFAEAVRMFERMPERTYRQEFLAEFIEDAGLVFRNVRTVSTAGPEPRIEGHSYVMGVDWAKSYDFTALSVLDATARRQVAVDRFNRVDYQFQVQRLKGIQERYRCNTIIAEANAMGEPLIEQLRRDGLPIRGFTTTSQSKTEAIEALALAIERAEVTLLDDETQIAELEAYDMERLPSGVFRYGAPEGMHDDTVMALALAWQGVARSRRPAFGAV